MKRWAAIVLTVVFLAIGSGAAEYLHHLKHAIEDVAQAKSGTDSHHDESNCQTCAQLHMPVISGGWVLLLVFLGIFVQFLTQLMPSLVSQRTIFHIACRGPPAC